MQGVQGVDVEFPSDVFGAVRAQDVEGKAAHPGEWSGHDADAAEVFEERDVPDVMAAILDGPVSADRGRDPGGAERGLTGVQGDLLGRGPEAGLGVLVPCEARDAGDADDQVGPVVTKTAGNVKGLNPAVLLTAMAVAINRFGSVGGTVGGADRRHGVEQVLLVAFDLDDQGVAGIPGRLKGFFDSAWRRR